MHKLSINSPLWLFVVPGSWISLFCVVLIAGETTWGISGHPSNGLLLFIAAFLFAPIFGVIGLVLIKLSNVNNKYYAKQISVVANSALILIGVGIWLWWS
jgi:hypothetical protein